MIRLSLSFARCALTLCALALPGLAQAQDYSDLPPLAPLSEAELRQLPPEYRTAPVGSETSETVIGADGVETITRTRRIAAPAPQPATAPAYAPPGYQPPGYQPPSYQPYVLEPAQWLEACRRRTGQRDRDDDEDRYDDCAATLDAYLAATGSPGGPQSAPTAYAAYPAPYGYGYDYAPTGTVLVPVRRAVPQQVVVRETVREETYTVPAGAARTIPAPAPSPKLTPTGR